MVLLSCYLHYVGKAHHFSDLCYLIKDVKDLNKAIFCFFYLKLYCILPNIYAHAPYANYWATGQKENRYYHSFEESDQRGLWIGRVKKFVEKTLTHVLFHRGKKKLRLAWPKWMARGCNGLNYGLLKRYVHKEFMDRNLFGKGIFVDVINGLKMRLYWVGMGPQSTDNCPYKRWQGEKTHRGVASSYQKVEERHRMDFSSWDCRRSQSSWHLDFELLASRSVKRINSYGFKPPLPWSFVTASHRKLILSSSTTCWAF